MDLLRAVGCRGGHSFAAVQTPGRLCSRGTPPFRFPLGRATGPGSRDRGTNSIFAAPGGIFKHVRDQLPSNRKTPQTFILMNRQPVDDRTIAEVLPRSIFFAGFVPIIRNKDATYRKTRR